VLNRNVRSSEAVTGNTNKPKFIKWVDKLLDITFVGLLWWLGPYRVMGSGVASDEVASLVWIDEI